MTNPGDPNFSDSAPEPQDSMPGGEMPGNAPRPGDLSSLNQPGGFGAPQALPGAEKKLAAGICGILLGALGVHKFILGYNTEGIIMVVVSVLGMLLSCLVFPILGPTAMGIIGLIEGIIYLTKTDQEFVETYISGKRAWF